MHSRDAAGHPGGELLRLARRSIEYGLTHREPLPIGDDLPRALAARAATFTTLHLDGRLRGCCGTLDAQYPLAVDVARSAFRAAFRDPRFEPVGEYEVSALRLQVSVLTPLEAVTARDESDLLENLKPGADGLVILAEGRRATFLPQVWDTLPDPRRFLAALKVKCGLPEDYWSAQLAFQRYRTSTYAEEGSE